MKDYRRDLLGHKNGDVTDLYCANELTRMLENANRVTQKRRVDSSEEGSLDSD